MRDKDSDLIFESYRKDILLNEVAMAIPLGIEAIAMAVGGTAAVLVVGNEIAKAYQSLTGQEQEAMKASLNSLNSLLEKKDYSAKGCYELINFIKSNSTDKELINFAESQSQVLAMANDFDNNVSWNQETLRAYVDASEAANTQLINFVRKPKQRSKLNISAEGDAADAIAAGLGGLMSGGGGGGGQQPPSQPPNKGSGWFAKILAVVGTITAATLSQVRKFVQSISWKFLAIAAVLAAIISPELAGELTRRIVGAAGSATKEGTKEIERQLKPSNKSKWVPEKGMIPNAGNTDNTNAPQPDPTPYVF
jgi:hypothetical protein